MEKILEDATALVTALGFLLVAALQIWSKMTGSKRATDLAAKVEAIHDSVVVHKKAPSEASGI